MTASDAVARLTAEADIAALVYRYALNVRSGAGAECAKLFADDAFFETRQKDADSGEWIARRIDGAEAIGAYIAKTGEGSRIYPAIQNLLIEVDGARATATCLMRGLVLPSGVELMGEYLDSFVDADGWRFASRTYWLHWTRRP